MLFEWDKIENAKKFASSEDLKKTMEQAGVIGIPHIHFLNEVSVSKAWKDLMWQGRPPPQISSGNFFIFFHFGECCPPGLRILQDDFRAIGSKVMIATDPVIFAWKGSPKDNRFGITDPETLDR